MNILTEASKVISDLDQFDARKGPNLKMQLNMHFKGSYEGCPKIPYNCIISLDFKTTIGLIHMHPVGNLFLEILFKLNKIS